MGLGPLSTQEHYESGPGVHPDRPATRDLMPTERSFVDHGCDSVSGRNFASFNMWGQRRKARSIY